MDARESGKHIPDSHLKGEKFEEYVRKNIFTKDHYIIVERTHGYLQNKDDFIESSINPDFKFRDKANNKEFYVEAKFRSEYHNQPDVHWCHLYQLERYAESNKNVPVIIVIGLGDLPENPKFLYFFSLSEK